ncbi:MAG: hypothetical protein HYV09_12390 [Deltaproteobacteria bacterium]|nr:hypothetical protein [Deltaproteobacteria bacterium]
MHRTPRVRSRGRPDRLVVVLSDIEMGAGGALDDFPNSPWLGDVLRRYLDPRYDDVALDLVFNGDTFDLLKTSHKDTWPHHVTSDVAVAKMSRVAAAHPAFFAALREVLARRGSRAAVHFVAGNHDLDLFFPEVQEVVRGLTAKDERVRFHGHQFELGRAFFEHGSQLDPLFRVEVDQPFLEHKGEKILNLAWASVALLDVVIPLQPLLHHHDRLKPKKLVLELVPEVKELLTSLAWSYWTRDWWRDYFGAKNPVKRVNWTMLKEVVWRFAAMDVEVGTQADFQRMMTEDDRYDLRMVGHVHEPGWWSFSGRRVLRTGALRDEFVIDADGLVQTPVNKTWAEVWMSGDEVVRAYLVDEPSPLRPPGTMPLSIFDVIPGVRALLRPDAARLEEISAQEEQERKEK